MITDSDVIEIASKYATPLYVFNEKEFINNYNNFFNTFKNYYKKYELSYSYKTNYTPYICKTVKDLGGYAEVVSGMEYYIAEKIGYDPEKIIFNGPVKGNDGIYALLKGSMVNVDNIEEIKKYIDLANKNKSKAFSIGIRVNINIGQDFVSRFGMEEADLKKCFSLVKDIKNLNIVGLHCHIGRCRTLDTWKKRTEIMLSLADKYFSVPPKYIDLGSGMFGDISDYFGDDFDNIPSYEDYAKVTVAVFEEHYKNVPFEEKPILFTEPGTTIINKYVDFIGEVQSIKKIKDKYFAQLNCSFHNLGETSTLVKLPLKILHNSFETKEYKSVDFAGYTCLQQDIMRADYNGKLGVGDYVVFGNVGGYSNVFKPPFINPQCTMLVLKTDGSMDVIKRKEDYEDILSTYIY